MKGSLEGRSPRIHGHDQDAHRRAVVREFRLRRYDLFHDGRADRFAVAERERHERGAPAHVGEGAGRTILCEQ
jgi:hypothetical protein